MNEEIQLAPQSPERQRIVHDPIIPLKSDPPIEGIGVYIRRNKGLWAIACKMEEPVSAMTKGVPVELFRHFRAKDHRFRTPVLMRALEEIGFTRDEDSSNPRLYTHGIAIYPKRHFIAYASPFPIDMDGAYDCFRKQGITVGVREIGDLLRAY